MVHEWGRGKRHRFHVFHVCTSARCAGRVGVVMAATARGSRGCGGGKGVGSVPITSLDQEAAVELVMAWCCGSGGGAGASDGVVLRCGVCVRRQVVTGYFFYRG